MASLSLTEKRVSKDGSIERKHKRRSLPPRKRPSGSNETEKEGEIGAEKERKGKERIREN